MKIAIAVLVFVCFGEGVAIAYLVASLKILVQRRENRSSGVQEE
jgi:hypothetical protein